MQAAEADSPFCKLPDIEGCIRIVCMLMSYLKPSGKFGHRWSSCSSASTSLLFFAGVKYTTVETEREGHAREVVQALSLAELQTYDGIVAVIASSNSPDMLSTSRFLLFPSGSDRLLCSCICMCSQLLDRGGQ